MCSIANVLPKFVNRLCLKNLARHSLILAPISSSLPHFLYKHKCIKIVYNCIKQRKSYKYIYFCFPLSPLPDLARHSPKSRSSPSPFSLIQTEAKCINCVSICIKREKIVYTHASTYIFVLYTYNYTIKILPCPVSFAFLSFSFYTIRFNCIFLVKSLLSFSLSHFIQIQIVYNRSIHLL